MQEHRERASFAPSSGAGVRARARVAVAALALAAAAADVLFQAAKDLAKQGKYADACPKFEASYKLDKTLGTLLNLADCHEHVGKVASAWAEWGEAADWAKKDADKRSDYAAKRRKALEPRLPKLTVHVTSPKASLDVLRDDEKLDPATFDLPLPVDPGPHAIVVQRGEQVLKKQSIDAVEGKTAEVTLDLAALDAAVPPPPPPPKPAATAASAAPPPPPPPAAVNLRTVGVVVGAVGLGAVIAAAGLEIGALAKKPSDTACVAKYCTPDGYSQVRGAQTLANVGQWVGIGGLVAVAVGATFFIAAPKSPSQPAAAASAEPARRATWVAPWAGPGGAGVAVGGAL
jgi:hypothetical protein